MMISRGWTNTRTLTTDIMTFSRRSAPSFKGAEPMILKFKRGGSEYTQFPTSSFQRIFLKIFQDYHFVSGDLKKVLEQAKEAAREKNVWIEGGASVAQQFINEGLVDEIVLTLVPKILGSGIHLF